MKIGIIGGGQLARMLILAGRPLGMDFLVLDPAADACASDVADLIQAEYSDVIAIKKLADQVDLVTFEFENVPSTSLHFLAEHSKVYPPPTALELAQDRFKEKTLFNLLDIETNRSVPVDTLQGLQQAVEQLGLPLVLKTRTLGYDGKGQFIINKEQDVTKAWAKLGSTPLIAEEFIQFNRELSIIAARSVDGTTAFYPVAENIHHHSMLQYSVCRHQDKQQDAAQAFIARLLDHVDYVGVLALELFERQGRLLANEIAPRVHNSGHWTIEGAETSQFENHLRAIAGLPLGGTRPVELAAMVNFIGKVPCR